MKSFNEILAEKKKKFGLTQPELAAIIGVQVRMFNLYLSGEYEGTEKRRKVYL